MPRALDALRRGQTVLHREHGQTYTSGAFTFAGIRQDKEQADPLHGTVRSTEITVQRSAIPTPLPRGNITDGTTTWRIVDIIPGPVDSVIYICQTAIL